MCIFQKALVIVFWAFCTLCNPMDNENNSDSFSYYVTFAQRVAQFGFFATTTSCTVLILLTIYGVKRDFGSYKNLLLMFAGLGIVFATTEVLLFPVRFSKI